MHLAEAIEAANKDPAKGFRRTGTPGLYFIDDWWAERGWLAFSHGGKIAGSWKPTIASWEAAQTDWEVVRLPAKLRRYIGDRYDDPLSASRKYRSMQSAKR